ncbi:MAG: hypothetical protein ACXVCP_06700 [Bdellovibrio sp.]
MKFLKTVLFSLGFAMVSSHALATTSDFIGTWVNINPSTKGIVRIVIDSSYNIRLFGACTPTPCDYGSVPMITYGSSVSDTNHTAGTAKFSFSFKMVEAVVYRNTPNMLILADFNQFTDNSGRQNYWMNERFRKAKANEVKEHFESQSREPVN